MAQTGQRLALARSYRTSLPASPNGMASWVFSSNEAYERRGGRSDEHV